MEQYKERTFDARVLGYVIPNAGTFNYNLLFSSLDTIFSADHMNSKGFRLDDITNPSDRYTATSNLHAGYAMMDNNFGKLRVVYGVRLENFIQKLNSFGYSNDTIEVNRNYLNLLPSMNFTYGLTEKRISEHLHFRVFQDRNSESWRHSHSMISILQLLSREMIHL